MAEFIEREKAIERIKPHVKPTTVYGEGYMQAIEHALDILELLPAADVQPVKRGRWENEHIEDGEAWWADCTNCKSETHSKFGRVSLYAFCPNCGARMDGEQNENN